MSPQQDDQTRSGTRRDNDDDGGPNRGANTLSHTDGTDDAAVARGEAISRGAQITPTLVNPEGGPEKRTHKETWYGVGRIVDGATHVVSNLTPNKEEAEGLAEYAEANRKEHPESFVGAHFEVAEQEVEVPDYASAAPTEVPDDHETRGNDHAGPRSDPDRVEADEKAREEARATAKSQADQARAEQERAKANDDDESGRNPRRADTKR